MFRLDEVGFGGTVLNGPDNYIAFRHNTNSEYYYYWLDDVEVSYMPDCAKPSNLTVSNITESTGDISWTPGNQGDNAWWLYYREADLSDWDSMEVFNNPYSLSNLIPDTDYEVYIKTICSSDVSEPSVILSFRTTCLPIDGEDDLPWEEGFENLLANTTLPNCWSATGFGTTTNTQTSNYGAYGRDARTGTGAAFFRWSANDSFTTPPFYLYEGEYYEFSFWYVTDGFDGWQTLKANANLPNGNTITIGDPVNNITNTVYQEYSAIIEALEDGYYSFDIEVNANSSPWYLTIDDVSLKVASGCIRPSTLSISNITSNSADLEWMAGGGSDFSWWVFLREDGEYDWDSVNVFNNPYTWSGLSPNTVYEFYVKTDCDNEVSEPSAIFSFETLCVPIDGEDDLPWEEGFEDLLANTTLPLCWSATNFGTATNTQVSNYNSYNRNARTGTGAAYFRWSANDSFTTPSFYLYEGDSYEFSFWYITDGLNGWQTLKAVLNKPDGSETVLGDIIETPSNTVYEQYSATFIVEEDGYYSINIAASANSSPYYLTFDDVKLQIEPNCKRPTSILAENITTAQADISWTPGSENDSQWRMYYQKQGDSEWDSITVTNNPYTLTGLSHSTTYNLYLKTDCSGELSEESSIITLRTDCDIISSIPWTEDFDIYGVVANTRPDCWTFPVIYSGYPAIVTGVSNVVSSPGSLRFQSQVGVYTYAITPPFEDDINELRVRFQLRAESISSSGTIEVGVMSDAADTSTFESIEIIQPINTSFNQYEVNFGGANLSGSGRHIAFRHNTVNSSWYYWLDDVVVDYIPACARPYNLSVTEISSSTALVSWLSGNQSDDAWWVLYKASNGGDWDSVYTNDNPYILTDLMAATAYEVAIRTDCNDEVSELSIVTFFNTSCHDGAIVDFPWEEGFESGLNCWGQENTLGSVAWSNSGSNGQAYIGSGYAYFYNPSSIAASTMLISPVLDISVMTSPYLSFWHTQKAWGSDQDELKVLYRESEDDDWEELLHYTDDIQIYQFDSIALPNPSSTYQIAFEGKAAYGYGVNLDDITVYDADADICLPPTNLEVVPYNTTAELSWTASGEELNWEVRLGENGTTEAVTIPSHTITDLTPNTNYTVYVRSNCGGVYSTWLSASFTTTDIIVAPEVTTDEVIINDIEKTAKFTGTVTENTEEVIARGFEYKTASEDWLDAEDLTATGSTSITAITPMLPMGDYLVRAYAETASGKTYGEELDFEITSSLSSIDINSLDITLYPNPATNTTTINIKGVDGKVIISIIDIQGRTITSVDKNSSENEIKHSFDLEGLAKGVYYIRVDAKNSIKTQKLIVQ